METIYEKGDIRLLDGGIVIFNNDPLYETYVKMPHQEWNPVLRQWVNARESK